MNITKRKIGRILVTVALPAALLWPAAPADAGHGGNVHCGVAVTASVTLNADVGPCAGHGIVAGANSITIDLNGFKVLGDVAANANSGLDEAGVYIGGRTGVVITDGTAPNANTGRRSNQVTGFDAGVGIVGGSGNTVQNLNIEGNVGTDGAWFGEGVHVRDSSSNTIKRNRIADNGPYAGITLLGADANSNSNVIGGADGDGNTIVNNNVANQDIGVRLESGTTTTSCTSSNTVSWNSISGSTIDGVSVLNGSNCSSTSNTISHNAIYANGRDGVRLNARCFSAASGTLPCAGNTVPRGALSNTVSHNAVCGNGGAGIRATSFTTGNTISDNQAGAGGTMHHGPAIPCAPNNPVTTAPPVGSPLLPPHGDLNDGNGNCTYNTWSGNTSTTKTPSCIS